MTSASRLRFAEMVGRKKCDVCLRLVSGLSHQFKSRGRLAKTCKAAYTDQFFRCGLFPALKASCGHQRDRGLSAGFVISAELRAAAKSNISSAKPPVDTQRSWISTARQCAGFILNKKTGVQIGRSAIESDKSDLRFNRSGTPTPDLPSRRGFRHGCYGPRLK